VEDKQDKILKILDIIDLRISRIELQLSIVNSPEFLEDDDTRYKKILKSLKGLDKVSVSFIQRKFSTGYVRAMRFMERLEKDGIIGPGKGVKPRKILR